MVSVNSLSLKLNIFDSRRHAKYFCIFLIYKVFKFQIFVPIGILIVSMFYIWFELSKYLNILNLNLHWKIFHWLNKRCQLTGTAKPAYLVHTLNITSKMPIIRLIIMLGHLGQILAVLQNIGKSRNAFFWPACSVLKKLLSNGRARSRLEVMSTIFPSKHSCNIKCSKCRGIK